MVNSLIDDLIVQILLERSSLTKNQFLAYLIRKGKIDKKLLEKYFIKEKIFRTRGALSGSFLQAKNNIKKSLLTVLLLFYLKAWEDKEERIIISLIEGLRKVADAPDDKKSDAISYIIKIVESMI